MEMIWYLLVNPNDWFSKLDSGGRFLGDFFEISIYQIPVWVSAFLNVSKYWILKLEIIEMSLYIVTFFPERIGVGFDKKK